MFRPFINLTRPIQIKRMVTTKYIEHVPSNNSSLFTNNDMTQIIYYERNLNTHKTNIINNN